MAGTYNPNAPNTIGVEWDEATKGVTSLSTPTTVASMLVTSTATETITNIYLPHSWTGPSSGFGKLIVDVYDLAATGAGSALSTTRYAPTGDTTVTQMFGTSPAWTSLSAGSVFNKVNDGASYNDANYLNFTWTGLARWKFGTAGFTGQVSSISFDIRCFGYFGTTGKIRLDLYNNTTFVATMATIAPTAGGDDTDVPFQTLTVGPFTTNPVTGVAWTATEVANMSTGTNLLWQLTTVAGNVAVSWVSMKVVSGTDARVATGSTATQTSLPAGVQTNLPCVLAASWAKVTGHTYLLVARRLDDPAGLAATMFPQPIYLAAAAVPTLQGTEYSTTVDSTGLLATNGSPGTKTYGFWLQVGSAMSVDSQPYYDLKLKPCHTSSTLEQFVSQASAQAYKGVTFLVGYATTPTASLTIKLKATSGGAQQGGTATVATTDVPAGTLMGTVVDATYGTISIYKVMVNLASSATLAAATDYFLEFTSTTTTGAPYLLVMLDGTATHTLTGNTTYQGSTDQANVAGSGIAAADFVARISSTPVTPSSITVTNVAATVNATTLDTAHIVWVNGGSLGANFSRWEVDRSEDGGTTWVNIFKIGTEATLIADDYEGKRGTACKYRVRSVRTDGAVSDYVTQSGTVTPAASTTGQIIYTTNAAPTLTVGYTAFGTSMPYDFLSAAETVYQRLHNRDFQAAFKPLEQRGISWGFEAQVNASAAAPTGGRGIQAFAALRAIADSAVPPYLCLHTFDGERFFGMIQVGQGTREEPVGLYLAKVVFTQTQGTGSAVTL